MKKLFIVFLLAGCTLPVNPDPIPSTDVFDHAVIDCNRATYPMPFEQVRACLHEADITTCMVGLTVKDTPDTVGCALVDLISSLAKSAALGTSTKTNKEEFSAANAWIRKEQVGVR
jgi:hypothetical protein